MDDIDTNNNNQNNQNSADISRPSLDSIPEISYKKEIYFRISLIVINVLSLIIGIYILKNHEYFLNEKYNFINHRALYVFIIIYTLGMIGALFLSFSIAVIAKLVFYFKNKKQNNNLISESANANLNNNNDPDHSRITSFILSNRQNEIAIIPFTLSYFIAVTIALYFISLPYSFFLIINLLKNNTYSKISTFFSLYFFLMINLFAGAIMIFVLFYMIFVKRGGSVRNIKYQFDNINIENIREEIRDAIKI